MLIYFFILILIIISSVHNSKKLTIFDACIFLILAIISGFRYNVGADFQAYVNFFERISNKQSTPADVGFEFVASIFSSIGFGSQMLFVFFSLVTLFFFYKGAKYYFHNNSLFKPVFYVIFLIFVYFYSFNVMRQVLAGSLIFYATKYIVENNFKKYSVWVILAMLFHYSSAIFFLLYFVVKRNYNKLLLFSFLIFIIFLSYNNVFSLIMEKIAYEYTFLDFGGYISHYVISSTYNSREMEYGLVFIINLLILLILIFYKNLYIVNKGRLISFNFYYIYIVFFLIAGDAFAFSRFQYHLSIYVAISISGILIIFDKQTQKIVKILMFVLYVLLYIYVIYRAYYYPGSFDMIPYNFNLNIFNE